MLLKKQFEPFNLLFYRLKPGEKLNSFYETASVTRAAEYSSKQPTSQTTTKQIYFKPT